MAGYRSMTTGLERMLSYGIGLINGSVSRPAPDPMQPLPGLPQREVSELEPRFSKLYSCIGFF